jgi:primosomal protein N'
LTRTKINKLVKAFNHNDKISQRQAAKKFECSQSMVSKVLKQNNIQVRHKTKIPERTEKQKQMARSKCGNLNLKNPNISWVLDDESYFTLSHSSINGNNFFYTNNIAETPASIKYSTAKKFESKLLVWICISDKGISPPIFQKSGLAVNKSVYW